jgi:virginiamycin B lyase
MKLLCALFLLVLLGVPSGAGQTFNEFPIPPFLGGLPAPARIAAGPDGNLWFTVQTTVSAPYVGRMTLEGVVTVFAIPTAPSGPLQITAGPDGNLWFTESFTNSNRIGRVSTSGTITEFPIPTANSETIGIAAGPDGALWFTEHSGDRIGRITVSGEITEFRLPGLGLGAAGITAGSDGALWFAEEYANKIGRITTSGVLTEFPVPTFGSGPLFIAAGPDDALWFGESSANKIGRITTSGEFTEFPIPTRGSQPYGIVAGIDGNLYFAEQAADKIGRITPSGAITEFPIPTPGKPEGIASGPDGAIWYTQFNSSGKVGRMTLGPLTCEPDSTTICLNGGRFRVTADWRKPDGVSGRGQAVRLTSDSGYFWFFSPSNIEILTKVVNGCVDPFNTYWVFSSGLTNVEVTLRVVDTQRGLLKTYVNPLNSAYQPIQDTSAFATCP